MYYLKKNLITYFLSTSSIFRTIFNLSKALLFIFLVRQSSLKIITSLVSVETPTEIVEASTEIVEASTEIVEAST